jgi:hypothetical protein
MYDTPSGYAATKSPIEGCNNKIKKIYRKRLRVARYSCVVKPVENFSNWKLRS